MTDTKQTKPKIAFFDFACCEGCQLTVLRLDEKFAELMEQVQIVSFREASSERGEDFDIAFCEGSVIGREEVKRLQAIREKAGTLVALGSCAAFGCHNELRNEWPGDRALEMVYGDRNRMELLPARSIDEVVDVDYRVLGCPVSLKEFETVLCRILTGQEYESPHQPVCMECKQNDYLCVLEKGEVCLGPLTRCGCDAICTAFGSPCMGCRGLTDEANLSALADVLVGEKERSAIMERAYEKNKMDESQIKRFVSLYNGKVELVDRGER